MKQAHLIGLGGAGVSAIAKYLTQNGYSVSGSDDIHTQTISDLEDNYAVIYTGINSAKNIHDDIDVVIYTPAVETGNAEYDEAVTQGIKMFSYPEYLGEISQYKRTIAIAGTNGKSTTTTMTAELLVDQGFDPSVIVGAVMKQFNSNYRAGESDLFVVEACEYKNSFLSLQPSILVITNMTPDHLDFFGDFETYVDAFKKLIGNMREGGTLICPSHDPLFHELAELAEQNSIDVIDFTYQDAPTLNIPGTHNVLNAQATLAILSVLGGDASQAQTYLASKFSGLARRFELIGKTEKGTVVYEDYAHNPEGLTLLIDGISRQYPDKNVHYFFQPHEYPRTKEFFTEFAQALATTDSLSLLPIYKARKPVDDSVSSELLAETIQLYDEAGLVLTPKDFKEAVDQFNEKVANACDMVIVVGAGDVWNISRMLTKHSHG